MKKSLLFFTKTEECTICSNLRIKLYLTISQIEKGEISFDIPPFSTI